MEALVLAAGLGTRIGKRHGIKPLLKIEDLPLIMFPIYSLQSIGVGRFIIVANQENIRAISEHIREYGLKESSFVLNSEPWRENGYSLVLGWKAVKGHVAFITMSDHIYPPEVPYLLWKNYEENRGVDVFIAGDKKPVYINIKEATLIETSEDLLVKKIGKGLDHWDFVDAGVLLFNRKAAKRAGEIAARVEVLRLSQLIEVLASEGLRVMVTDITGVPWTEVDTPEDLAELRAGSRREIVKEVIKSWGER